MSRFVVENGLKPGLCRDKGTGSVINVAEWCQDIEGRLATMQSQIEATKPAENIEAIIDQALTKYAAKMAAANTADANAKKSGK